MDPFAYLLLLCLAIFAGASLAGYLPLAFKLGPRVKSFVTSLGAGLLVGTALIVIIPEAVHMLYSQPQLVPVPVPGAADHDHDHDHDHAHEGEAVGHTHQHGKDEPGVYIGTALALGFVFMLLVERCSGAHKHEHDTMEDDHSECGDVHRHDATEPPQPPKPPTRKNIATVFGLVVHNMVDGVALGAASYAKSGSLELVVFIAILAHKAPGAFGISSFLLHSGESKARVMAYLAVFSSAVPLAAVLTYFFLGMELVAYGDQSIALCLMFSGGTFLYVSAAHILPEVQSAGGDGHSSQPWRDVVAMVIGILAPLFINMEHEH